MIPLLHDFEGEIVLVFGGGTVGARKARRFTREAHVVVVSPSFVDADFGGASRVRAAPDASDVGAWIDSADPALVVAATDDGGLNEAVTRAGRERGVLVNRADEGGAREFGSVVVPATVRDGPVVAAVATGAKSPALSRYLRERIEETVHGAGAMAEMTAALREDLKERLPSEGRQSALRAVVRSDEVWKALDTPSTNPRQVASDVISDVRSDST
ncbi:MAG: bifunctional precorrin-2 dehydrogenase/sirohydrochlorin ferrochelatase [Haloarculaceae archaeon]